MDEISCSYPAKQTRYDPGSESAVTTGSYFHNILLMTRGWVG